MRLQTWPTSAKIVEREIGIEAHSRGVDQPGGASNHAIGTGARWVGGITVAAMVAATALSFRAFLHSLRGRSGSFMLPADSYLSATTSNPLTSTGGLAEYTDDYRFSDGTAYSDIFAPTFAPLATAAAVGATVLEVNKIAGVTLVAGQWLYVEDPTGATQLFRATAFSTGSTTWTITVRPRVRAALIAGSSVEFASITAPFRLASDDTPAVPIVAGGRSLPVQIEIEEAY